MQNEHTDPAGREQSSSFVIDAPVELVWTVWTQPDHIKQWWGPDGFTNSIEKMDVRPGGEWTFIMHGPDGKNYNNRIAFREVGLNQKIVLEHFDPNFIAIIKFENQGAKTFLNWYKLYETKELFNLIEAQHQTSIGFKQTIEKLRTYAGQVYRQTLRESKSLEEVLMRPENKIKQLYAGVELPSLVSRVKALFVDLLIVLVVFALTAAFIDSVTDISDFLKGSILIFMLYLYDPLMTSLTGSTLGHKMMNLKVRRYDNPEKHISLFHAFVRFLVKGLLGWLSFLTVTGTRHKRAIHDMTGGSIVLYDK